MCSSCGYLRPFLPPGRGQGEEYAPLSRHHVGNRACVAARPERRHPQPTPSLVTGISWGCLRVVDGNAGTVSSFPARTTVARHDRFCLQVLAWLVRPCGFDACPSCVSSSLVHAAPWLAGPREAEGGAAGEAGLDLSKEHLRTQELESCAPVADTFGLSFLREGSGGGVRPPSRHHVGNRACVAARPGKKTPQPTPHLLRGISWGVSGSLTAMRARFRAFQHGQQSQDMTGSACRFWRGLCVRAGSMLARRVSQVLWSTPPPWLAGPREAEGVRPAKPA